VPLYNETKTIMSKYCIGIDLGGTFVKFGILDDQNRPGQTFQLRTPDDPEAVIQQMIHGAKRLIDQQDVCDKDILGVGIGSPGPLDMDKGLILDMPNIAGMKNMPIRDRIADGLALPAVLENDANAAAYGEYLLGAGREAAHMVLLTLGTGIGSGIVVDGEVLHGSHGIGAELGHMLVDPGGEPCGCGQRGCLERYSSATNLALRAQRRIEQQNHTGLLASVWKQSGNITAKEVEEAAAAGDELAGKIWDEAIYYLAVACVNIIRIFDPDQIVLAGGMTAAGEALMRPLLRHVGEVNWSLTELRTKIAFSQLGNDAGVIGAAGVAWAKFAPET